MFKRFVSPHPLLVFLVSLFLLAPGCRHTAKPAEQRAYTPQESLAAIKPSEDFHVELFLSEPQVMSPVEMVFDENGRLYVAEMLDYPDDPPPGKPARSRIKLLEDNDGDGKYERATIFADQVLEVSGLLPWRGGVIVTSAPDILWMKDTDGDGKADIRRVIYTGFPKVNPEARITNPRYGIDNWIYTSNNGRDGRITSPESLNELSAISHQPSAPPPSTSAHSSSAHSSLASSSPAVPASQSSRSLSDKRQTSRPQEPVLVRGADFRFHPVRDRMEASSGPAQFGLTFDEWGNEFITENTTHLRHVILPMNYIARAPTLEVPAYALNIYEGGKTPAPIFPLTGPQEWRKQRTALRQQRYDEQGLNRTEYVGGHFSGASGGTVYTGDAWPAEYRGSIFTGEVSANLIHRDVLTPDGVTFKAERAKPEVEFMASTDQWFRPCNFANAPDGNLYVMDVYRLFIETPESIPEEIKKGMDFYAGDTMGRIYRIASNHPRQRRSLKPALGTASVEELVRTLAHENGWHRMTAQRLIVERQDRAAIPFLKQLLAQTPSPVARVHALWTLEGLSALDEPILLQALRDEHPRVREHAVRLAEEFLPKSKAIADALLAMANETEARVQLQRAFTLGELKDARALDELGALAETRSDNQWFRLAILSSVNDSASQFFHALRAKRPAFENKELFAQLASLIATKQNPAELAKLLPAIQSVREPEAMLAGLNRGLQLAGAKSLRVAGTERALAPLLASPNDGVQRAAWETARYFDLPGIVQRAIIEAQNAALALPQRTNAVRALRGGQFAQVAPILQKLLTGQEQPELQLAAVDSLASFNDAAVAPALLDAWKYFSPEVRAAALTALLGERERMKQTLAALEAGRIERTMIDPAMQARLFDHPDKAVAERARAFFKQEADERTAAVAEYQDALKLTGDVNRGRDLFASTCAKCHVAQKGRQRIGADLSGINNKTKEELLNSILNPSAAIEPRFVNYIITTKDGRITDGILANETPGSVTLRNADADTTILRKNIAEIRASSLSLMPDGMEKSLSKQQVADVIAYLRGGL